ncbi:S-adenosyl-L-methionine-dependent methyltransferase [Cladochytrium replicatum]|nr:S-adenosyl-L-methionine-dependent methyltransferase [Cladochytrium replicatum]
MSLDAYYEPLLDRGYLPDTLTRFGIRYLLGRRLAELKYQNVSESNRAKLEYVKSLKVVQTLALNTKEANEQHYEVPTDYFRFCLGERMKYSSCLFETGAKTLEEAEVAMLDLYVQRADVKEGQTILDLGCGWGSLCLYLAERFPNNKISALSNSNTQREYIMGVAREKGFKNLTVFTGDVNTYDFTGKTFDRIISIEMFEHMKNYDSVMKKVSTWLVPETGRLFVHVFCHKTMPYNFDADEEQNSWMARYFFTGGTMPSEDLFMFFQTHVEVVDRWTVDGKNYGETSEQWLKRMDANRAKILPILAKAYGSAEQGFVWFQRWRVFYLACAELFNYNNGQEWFVVHYLFKRK